MHLLHLGEFREPQHPLAFSPAIRIDMHEGQKRFANSRAIKPCGRAGNNALRAEPLYALEDGRRGQPDALADIGIGQTRILGQCA